MPLDAHSYLAAYGWAGKGTGLRHDAIIRPLAIPQKKTLAGLGKDRDEAFPFWDHLFSAAASSIQLKVASDGSDESEGEQSASTLKRTSTGILSNRRPTTGISAIVSTSTASDQTQRPSLLSIAKREAAKSGLYARFFKGPVLGTNDFELDEDIRQAPTEALAKATKTRGMFEASADTQGQIKKRRKKDSGDDRQRKRRRKEVKGSKKEAGAERNQNLVETKEIIDEEHLTAPGKYTRRKIKSHKRELKESMKKGRVVHEHAEKKKSKDKDKRGSSGSRLIEGQRQ